jgi:hypothetical protein
MPHLHAWYLTERPGFKGAKLAYYAHRLNRAGKCLGRTRPMAEQKKEKPTAIKLLKQELARFLASPDPEVMCIRGKWGVGKTYAWNEELTAARDREKGIALGKYAYVSLFGVQSLDQLKYSIFENTVDSKDIGTVPTIENLRKNSIAVSKQFGRQALSKIVSYIPFIKDAVGTLQVISFLTVKNQLICIDESACQIECGGEVLGGHGRAGRRADALNAAARKAGGAVAHRAIAHQSPGPSSRQRLWWQIRREHLLDAATSVGGQCRDAGQDWNTAGNVMLTRAAILFEIMSDRRGWPDRICRLVKGAEHGGAGAQG